MLDIDWMVWLGQCRFIETILIIDEAQLIHGKEKKVDQKNGESADQFWMLIKGILQEVANMRLLCLLLMGIEVLTLQDLQPLLHYQNRIVKR